MTKRQKAAGTTGPTLKIKMIGSVIGCPIKQRATVSAAVYWTKNKDEIFFTQTGRYRASAPPPGWPLPPVVLEVLPPPCTSATCTSGGLPSEFGYRNLGTDKNKGFELGIDGDGEELLYFRSQLVLASKLAGVQPPVDGPCTNFHDVVQVSVHAERARRLGFGGVLCIHPQQVAAVNAAFTPTASQVTWAQRVLDAATRSGGAAPCTSMMSTPRATASSASAGPVTLASRKVMLNRT